MRYIIIWVVLIMFITGCSSETQKKIQHDENEVNIVHTAIGNPTADEVLTKYKQTDIFLMNGIVYVYAEEIDWVKDLDLTIGKDSMARKGSLSVKSWGLESKHNYSSAANGAFGFNPVINEASDLEKLKIPQIIYDEKSTIADFEEANDLFGDILDVRLNGINYISFHFMSSYCHLRGLEQMMYDLYDNPDMVHNAMRFFKVGYDSLIDQCLAQNLFSYNNDDTYHSSGGIGYSYELAHKDFIAGKPRTCDLWASAESQEMVQVSTDMHEEFVMQYE